MGAAGLTCSAVEMGAKGDLGVTLDIDRVPCRETGMSAYEMMLSESQERMLMVLKPEKEKEAEAIFRKWGLDFAIVGETTPTKRFIVRHGGAVMADLPIKEFGDEAPVYERHFLREQRASDNRCGLGQAADEQCRCARQADRLAGPLLEALGLGAIRPRHSRQYRAAAGRRRRRSPRQRGPEGAGADVRRHAALLRGGSFVGGKQAVAEAWRNLTAVGAQPLALTDNLNFGNPERPETMGQFVGCVRGIGEACRVLDFPVVSGNVSLYNETNGRAILPTPTIGGVGLLDDFTTSMTLAFKSEGEAILVIGETRGWLGRSVYLRDVCGREEGAPPPVDLAAERRHGDFVRSLIRAGAVTAVHDVSDGGLLIALAEMAMASGIGAVLEAPSKIPPHAFWFGEDQARYIVTAKYAHSVTRQATAVGVPLLHLGATGGAALAVDGERPLPVAELKRRFEAWLPAYMAGQT